MLSTSSRMFVTSVSTFNKYLKINGQMNQDIVSGIDNKIECLIKNPEIRNAIPNIDQLQIGTFCLALNVNKFVRGRIVRIMPPMNKVIVHYLDFGFDQQIDISEVRVGIFPRDLEFMSVQATPFIVCDIISEWQPYQLQQITEEILFHYVDVYAKMDLYGNKFAVIFWKNKNLANYIIEEKGFGVHINQEQLRVDVLKLSKQKHSMSKATSVTNSIRGASKNIVAVRQPYGSSSVTQETTTGTTDTGKPVLKGLSSFRSMIQGIQNENTRMPYTGNPMYNMTAPRTTIENMLPSKIAVATFKTTTLMVGNKYDVDCCYVENGPCSFTVHLKSQESDLLSMMSELEKVPLKNITEKPTLGMACIARFSEDNQFYRAIIMNIKLSVCQVSYVDYGNNEYVPYHDLYEIPNEFLDQKCFSIRFALSGYKELEPINDNLKNMFKDLVLYKSFTLKVAPLEGPPLVQYCELYDHNNANIVDILKDHKNRKLSYVPNETLDKSNMVIVCYIESPKKFFVQKLNNQAKFESMMDELFLYCNKNKSPLQNYAKGTACAVKFENAWYRAEIIEQEQNNRVTIRHVDFGNERKCDPSNLTEIAEQFTLDAPQAIQCCLKGYENSGAVVAENIITQFEMLAESSDGERRQFKANILKMHTSNCYLVNLIDETISPALNLMRRLFKLNMPFNKYIGMEKENFNEFNKSESREVFSTQSAKPKSQSTAVIKSNGSQDDQINTSWERGSTGSGESSSKIKRRNSPQQSSNVPKYETVQSRLAPSRFQNQNEQDKNRRLDNNNYEKQQDISSETSGVSSQSPGNSFDKNSIGSHDNWRSTAVTKSAVEEYISIDCELPKIEPEIPSTVEVVICWWISPNQFYVHFTSRTGQFQEIMKDIQLFYKDKEPTKKLINVGANVIGRYRADNTLYRAKVLACNPTLRKYKVEFVDFGNQSLVDEKDVWEMEKRFANEPIMTQVCAFENVVSNFDAEYIINELEKYLKPSVAVQCDYLRLEKNKQIVDIVLRNGKRLKDLLIENGLISELAPEIKLEVLVGQRIKGKIVSVKDLLCFQIIIEGCEVKLLCSYHDTKFVKSNSQLSSTFKNDFEGKTCTFDITEVTGDKLLMVKPILSLFNANSEIQPAICSLPVLSDMINAKVTYVDSANKLYLTATCVETILNNLLNNMFNHYETNGVLLNEFQLGLLCAVNSADGNWYRGQIISSELSNEKNQNDSIQVFYIDYGNTEIINDKTKLKRLDDKFLSSSALAMEIYFPIKSIKTDRILDCDQAVIDRINLLTASYEIQVKLLDSYENAWIADILNGEASLINVLADEKLIEKNQAMELIKSLILQDNKKKLVNQLPGEIIEIVTDQTESNNNKYSIKSLETINETTKWKDCSTVVANHVIATNIDNSAVIHNRMFEGYISHCDNPTRFFLQLTSETDDLQKLQDNIQIVANSLPPLMTNVTGASCIALYGVDNVWYRAKIVDSEIMAVQFTDYGNTDVDIDPEKIREMNEAFVHIKSFAIPCALAIAPIKSDWDDTANKIFLESLEKTVFFDIICSSRNFAYEMNYINLIIDNINIADYLCEKNLARKLKCVESGAAIFISHVNNLSDFYIEYESDAAGLSLIAEHLSNFKQFPIIPKSNDGTTDGLICAAVFPDDGEWYRAKIIKNTLDGFEVQFIDFGNTSLTYETRELSCEISKIPPLAHKCSLRKPDTLIDWSDSAEESFLNLSAGGENKFIVEMEQPTIDYSIVELFIDGNNLFDIIEPSFNKSLEKVLNMSTSTEIAELQSVVKAVIIAHINSPGDFYVHENSDIPKLKQITSSLATKLTEKPKFYDPAVGEICAAVFPDDGELYRAKVLSKEANGYNVIFIDFGNCSISNDLRELPEELRHILPFAKQCSLALVNGNLGSQEAITAFEDITSPIMTEMIIMTIINDHQTPWIVKLSHMNVDISEVVQMKLESTDNLDTKQALQNVTISHVISPSEFYIQMESEIPKIENISTILTDQSKLITITEQPKCGEICAALFPDDESFYRAKIMQVDETEANVFFIDFGNSSKTYDLRILPKDLHNMEPMAIKCSLKHNLDKQYPSEIIKKNFVELMDSHFGEIFQIAEIEKSVTDDSGEQWNVVLLKHNSDIAIELGKILSNENGVCDASAAPINNVKKCRVSHCNSPNDFYIQLANDTNELAEIAKKLSEASSKFEKFTTPPKCNELCAAKYSADGAFYRAKIISADKDGWEVLYIDFGNVEKASELRQLPNELKLIAGYGKHCALENQTEVDFSNCNAIECFQSLMNLHVNETFQVDVLNDSNDPCVVKLYYKDKNFVEDLYSSIREMTMRGDQSSNWDTLKTNNLTSSTNDINMMKDILNDIANSPPIISHEIINDIVDNFTVPEYRMNSTGELAAELYHDFQRTVSQPNVVRK